MKDSDVIRSLQRDHSVKIDSVMVRNCISELPEIVPGSSWMPLLRLQIAYFPKWMYAGIVLLFLGLILLGENLSALQMVWWSGRMVQTIVILLGAHFMMADWNHMRELEYSCKYQYSQIYLSRIILSACYIVLFDLGLNVMFLLQFGTMRILWNVLILFPLVFGAVCALSVMQLFHLKNDIAPFATMIAVSLMAQFCLYEWQSYIDRFEVFIMALFILLGLLMVVQAWHLIGRRWNYETYNM